MNTLWVMVVGLCVGSFLNVVIYRLPRILMQHWRAECQGLLGQSVAECSRLRLHWPASHCPHCQQALRWRHNIPLLSFLCLRGRCAFCQKSIAWHYPTVELLSALSAGWLYYHFGGFNALFFASTVFSWILLALIFIDYYHQLLPDQLTLALLWGGLLLSLAPVFATPEQAILGAAVGYGVLWLIAQFYYLLTRREGMGQGDFKLLAALGAWTGLQSLLAIILLASLLGLVIGSIWLLWCRKSRHTPFAFGPYLAIAGWIVLTQGNWLVQWGIQTW